MKLHGFPIIVCGLLGGCAIPLRVPSTGSGGLNELLRTASGYVIEAGKQAAATVELGKMGLEKGKETLEDLQKRAQEIQQGMDSIKKGKEQIQEGLAQ